MRQNVVCKRHFVALMRTFLQPEVEVTSPVGRFFCVLKFHALVTTADEAKGLGCSAGG
jgi:hypothetical protein